MRRLNPWLCSLMLVFAGSLVGCDVDVHETPEPNKKVEVDVDRKNDGVNKPIVEIERDGPRRDIDIKVNP